MIMLIVIFSGFFNTIDLWVREFGYSEISSGLIFFGVLFFLQDIISTPFSIYSTFILEEKYGFNKTTPKTFILDKIKAYILIAVLGGIILYAILYFFQSQSLIESSKDIKFITFFSQI